ncbi:hypothetical protein K100096D8_26790 [Eggerthella lenta]
MEGRGGRGEEAGEAGKVASGGARSSGRGVALASGWARSAPIRGGRGVRPARPLTPKSQIPLRAREGLAPYPRAKKG